MPRRPTGQQITRLGNAAAENTRILATTRQDFTYKKLTGLDLRDTTFRQSLFIGTIFQRCQFTSVGFDRCDFCGVKFVDCVFDRCSFVPTKFAHAPLTDVRFETPASADHNGCGFKPRTLRSRVANFREASIGECEFYLSSFSDCRLKRSSLSIRLLRFSSEIPLRYTSTAH
jgi:uncharacterized protein YjbI with pentapeptide repeats